MVVAAAGVIVPRRRRADWAAEWRGELWGHLSCMEPGRRAGAHAGLALFLRTLGAVPHALWVLRDEWRLEMLLHDLRYAVRTLAKRPGFTAVVLLTLAVGIGANSAMFSIVNSVLIRPLPYPDADRLMFIYGAFRGGDEASISPPDFLDYRERNTVFSSMAARSFIGDAVLTGGEEPERVSSALVTTNFFATLGVLPLIGRAFLAEEERGAGHDVAIISYGLWQRRFAGDRRVVGREIQVDGRPHTIVGVTPAVLDRTLDVQVWRPIPFGIEGTSVRRFHFLRGLGRLEPGVTPAVAQRQLDDIARMLERTYPENESWKLRIVPYKEMVLGGVGRALLILLGAVGVVLLIACANVASLMMARGIARRGEIAVRTALGASRMSIVRQLLTESLTLGLTAGALGIAVGLALLEGVRTVSARTLPRLAEIEMDGTALAFTIALSILTSVVFGLAPALHVARQDLGASVRTLGRSTADRSGLRLRDALVVGQVALSLVLLVSAGLLVRSLWSMQRVDTGFDSREVLTAQITLPQARYESRESHQRFWSALLERAAAVPGVEIAAGATMPPLVGGGDTYFYVEKRPPATDADRMNALINVVTDDYFRVMRIPVVAGRTFGSEDRGGAGAVVINRTLADRLFPGASALGERLVVDFGQPFAGTIIGVVGDVRSFGPRSDPSDILYFTNQQATGFGPGNMNLVVRARQNAASLVAPLRAVLRELEPDSPLANPRTMEQLLSDSVSDASFRARLLGGFAAVALALAVVGLYGILAYSVTQRIREVGIRLALGASRGEVFRMVVRQGAVLVIAGVALGIPAALGASRLLEQLLFEVRAADLGVYATVTAALGCAGLAACLIPARRATRVDPLAALREE
jgi:putative ABC transport system permease protein